MRLAREQVARWTRGLARLISKLTNHQFSNKNVFPKTVTVQIKGLGFWLASIRKNKQSKLNWTAHDQVDLKKKKTNRMLSPWLSFIRF